MRTSLQLALICLVIVLAGCISTRKAVPAHPLVGDWSYRVDTDERTYRGVLSFEVTEDGLQGTVGGDGMQEGSPLANLTYEAPKLTFEIQSAEYGRLKVAATVEGDSFAGEMDVQSQGVVLPISGSRIVSASVVNR